MHGWRCQGATPGIGSVEKQYTGGTTQKALVEPNDLGGLGKRAERACGAQALNAVLSTSHAGQVHPSDMRCSKQRVSQSAFATVRFAVLTTEQE